MHRFVLDLALAAPALLAKAPSKSSQWVWLAVGALIAAAWYGLSRWNRSRRPQGSDTTSAEGLFAELAAAHNLSRTERNLLADAAASRGLKDPAVVFVDPGVLGSLTGPGAARSAEHSALARKLFG